MRIPFHLAGDVTAGAASPADLAEVVTAGVASSANHRLESGIGPSYGSIPPHEKHPSTESDGGSGEIMSSSVTVRTGSQFSNNVSKLLAGDRSCATGVGGHIAFISCWMRRSRSERIGAACRGCGAGVGNSFLMMSTTVFVSGDTAGVGSTSVT